MIAPHSSVMGGPSFLRGANLVASSSGEELQLSAKANSAPGTISTVTISGTADHHSATTFAGLVAGAILSVAIITAGSSSTKRQMVLLSRAAVQEQIFPWSYGPLATPVIVAPGNPSWVALLDDPTLARPEGGVFMEVVDGLLDLVSDGSFEAIDRVFEGLDVSRVSTDFLVALLRLTFPERAALTKWNDFLARVKPELNKREGVDSTLELDGLNDHDVS